MIVDRERLVKAIEAKFDEIAGREFEYLARNLVDQEPLQAVMEFSRGMQELMTARDAALKALDAVLGGHGNEEAT